MIECPYFFYLFIFCTAISALSCKAEEMMSALSTVRLPLRKKRAFVFSLVHKSLSSQSESVAHLHQVVKTHTDWSLCHCFPQRPDCWQHAHTSASVLRQNQSIAVKTAVWREMERLRERVGGRGRDCICFCVICSFQNFSLSCRYFYIIL